MAAQMWYAQGGLHTSPEPAVGACQDGRAWCIVRRRNLQFAAEVGIALVLEVAVLDARPPGEVLADGLRLVDPRHLVVGVIPHRHRVCGEAAEEVCRPQAPGGADDDDRGRLRVALHQLHQAEAAFVNVVCHGGIELRISGSTLRASW